MSTLDRVDNAEKAFQDGDRQALRDSVIDVQDNQQFMKFLGNQMSLSEHKLNLPGLEIVDNDNDGSPESIHSGKLTLSKDGDALKVTTDSKWDTAVDKVSDFISGTSRTVDSAMPENRKPVEPTINENERRQLKDN